jgi:hypothetical protein
MEINREINFFLFIKLNVNEGLIFVVLLDVLINKSRSWKVLFGNEDCSSNNKLEVADLSGPAV